MSGISADALMGFSGVTEAVVLMPGMILGIPAPGEEEGLARISSRAERAHVLGVGGVQAPRKSASARREQHGFRRVHALPRGIPLGCSHLRLPDRGRLEREGPGALCVLPAKVEVTAALPEKEREGRRQVARCACEWMAEESRVLPEVAGGGPSQTRGPTGMLRRSYARLACPSRRPGLLSPSICDIEPTALNARNIVRRKYELPKV